MVPIICPPEAEHSCEEMQLDVHAPPMQVSPKDEEEVNDDPAKVELAELMRSNPTKL